MEKLVTVFMPVYNTEKYLRQSIESILNQTYKNFELLIIDDGSTDSSVDIIKSYNDDRIILVKNEKNKGLPYTRNKGLDLAKGEYIALMDSDDISKNNRLAIQVKFLEKHKEIQVVGSRQETLIEGKIYKPSNARKEYIDVNKKLMFYSCVPNPTIMFRKDFFYKNKIRYRKECFVAQDYAFFVDCVAKGGNIAILSEPVLIYRSGHDNITKLSVKYKQNERKKVMDNIRIRCLNNNGIFLDDKENILFNKIFSDPIMDISIDDINEYKKLINKILLIKNNINKKGFADEIKLNLLNRLLDINATKIQKIGIINFKIETETVMSYVKSIIKVIMFG
ncbi:Undecaprenyl-phosphate 4-deoxy-4-formamido-L-arabinose transferase [Terrisporobacter petrolearius]|uniref:Undecaprenyl-phosphate 4-deoxy-4-formamido-L-arabinose transferase n=1 Tax=Terrisporobacter petrolearius TaxID=1460447 RepID=A0ABZ3FD02_9FIRM